LAFFVNNDPSKKKFHNFFINTEPANLQQKPQEGEGASGFGEGKGNGRQLLIRL
jgi:hypothetical protein